MVVVGGGENEATKVEEKDDEDGKEVVEECYNTRHWCWS